MIIVALLAALMTNGPMAAMRLVSQFQPVIILPVALPPLEPDKQLAELVIIARAAIKPLAVQMLNGPTAPTRLVLMLPAVTILLAEPLRLERGRPNVRPDHTVLAVLSPGLAPPVIIVRLAVPVLLKMLVPPERLML
jgi:hypothetical protein